MARAKLQSPLLWVWSRQNVQNRQITTRVPTLTAVVFSNTKPLAQKKRLFRPAMVKCHSPMSDGRALIIIRRRALMQTRSFFINPWVVRTVIKYVPFPICYTYKPGQTKPGLKKTLSYKEPSHKLWVPTRRLQTKFWRRSRVRTTRMWIWYGYESSSDQLRIGNIISARGLIRLTHAYPVSWSRP